MFIDLLSPEEEKWINRFLWVIGILAIAGLWKIIELLYHLVAKG